MSVKLGPVSKFVNIFKFKLHASTPTLSVFDHQSSTRLSETVLASGESLLPTTYTKYEVVQEFLRDPGGRNRTYKHCKMSINLITTEYKRFCIKILEKVDEHVL